MTYREPLPRRSRPLLAVVGSLVVVALLLLLGAQLLAPSSSTADEHGPLGQEDGVVTGDVTVFDDVPAVTRLAPALLNALRRAARAATSDDVELHVDSGWRSARYQEQLFRAAVAEYGSEQAAARWVATPSRSQHVSGDAVDVGHADADAWLSAHGAAYGLCQIYDNEPWHYELRPGAVGHGCPPRYADPSQDPRMHG